MEKELVERKGVGTSKAASYGGVSEATDEATPNNTSQDQCTEEFRLWNIVYYVGWVSFIMLLVLGILSIALGKAYDRASVFAFGFSALLDGACAGVVVWRSYSMRNGNLALESALKKELVADFMLGVIFIFASVVILVNSIKGLYKPFVRADNILLIVTGIGGGIEIIFCFIKIHLGRKLNSASVLADGINSLVCGLLGLSVIPSVTIGLQTHNGSADHILGIIVAVFVFIYGLFLLFQVLTNPLTRTLIKNNYNTGESLSNKPSTSG